MQIRQNIICAGQILIMSTQIPLIVVHFVIGDGQVKPMKVKRAVHWKNANVLHLPPLSKGAVSVSAWYCSSNYVTQHIQAHLHTKETALILKPGKKVAHLPPVTTLSCDLHLSNLPLTYTLITDMQDCFLGFSGWCPADLSGLPCLATLQICHPHQWK